VTRPFGRLPIGQSAAGDRRNEPPRALGRTRVVDAFSGTHGDGGKK
jgi:hypothetical protein